MTDKESFDKSNREFAERVKLARDKDPDEKYRKAYIRFHLGVAKDKKKAVAGKMKKT